MSRFASFQELQAEAMRLREAGDASAALALMNAEGDRFPDQSAYAFFWRMRLCSDLGRLDDALRILAEALAAGCRYPLPVLLGGQLAPLHDTVEFERLAHIAAMRYDAELAAARPKLVIRRPATAARGTLLVLHGNNSRADRTVPHWEHALELGWTLALAQSAEISWTPGMFVWNDATHAREQLTGHLEELRSSSQTVVGGFSMGALRALELAASVPDLVRGVVAVGPYIPPEPAAHLADALRVPTAIVVGERDREGRPGAEIISGRLREHGVPIRYDVVPGLGHAYPPDIGRRLEAALSFMS